MKNRFNISVVLCTYNGELFIKEQLDSILNQTLFPYEIIIQDDCSTDDTWKIICDYAKRYSIIKKFRNDNNLRAHANFISAFNKASCDYIAPSDQDDIWSNNKLEVLAENLAGKNLAFSRERILFEDGTLIEDKTFMLTIDKLMWGNNLKGHTFLFKRDLLCIYQFAGQFISFDYCLALNACVTNDYSLVTDHLSIWRRHPGTCTTAVSMNHNNEHKQISSWTKTFKTMKLLYIGEKSEAITLGLGDRSRFILSINKGKKSKLISMILGSVSKQTLFEMYKAGFYNVLLLKYNKEFSKLKFITKLKTISFNFRTPFMYWYEMRNERALE